MKNTIKILLCVIIAAAIIITLLSAYITYEENGGSIDVKTESSAALAEKLDMLGIPYGSGSSDKAGYDRFMSRAELMPIILNISKDIGIETEAVFMHAHTHLFYSIILSAAAGCVCFITAGAVSKKRFIRDLMLSAAFITAAGCLVWLAHLPLSVL